MSCLIFRSSAVQLVSQCHDWHSIMSGKNHFGSEMSKSQNESESDSNSFKAKKGRHAFVCASKEVLFFASAVLGKSVLLSN